MLQFEKESKGYKLVHKNLVYWNHSVKICIAKNEIYWNIEDDICSFAYINNLISFFSLCSFYFSQTLELPVLIFVCDLDSSASF